MCYLLFAIVNVINCVFHLIFKTIMTIFAMMELFIKTILQILFNILLLILQVISVIPVCCAFIITSKLRCFMCRRGPDCSIIRGGLSEIIISMLLFILILLIMKVTGVLDTLLNSFGYVKKTKSLLRSGPDLTQLPISFSQVQYVTDYNDAEDQIKEVTVAESSSSKSVKIINSDFRSLFKPEQYYSTTETMPNVWNLPFGIL